MWKLWCEKWLASVLTLLCALTAVVALLVAKKSLSEEDRFIDGLSRVEVVPPDTRPAMSQDSINLALVMFNIEVPENARHPILDPFLVDRGRTTLYGYSEKLEVAVGPNAFTSWSILGATLAHELEVHCHQSFALIRLLDSAGLLGTENAEREAYLHELSGSRRFHLTAQEQENISQTLDYFYPTQTKNTLSAAFVKPVDSWLTFGAN
ncbi:MAG: hypothetical protein AB7T49_15895 [Oligoflexales bacterium]